jgi:hypothetical protein
VKSSLWTYLLSFANFSAGKWSCKLHMGLFFLSLPLITHTHTHRPHNSTFAVSKGIFFLATLNHHHPWSSVTARYEVWVFHWKWTWKTWKSWPEHKI